MTISKLDRRSFIKTAGLVTAGGAAATALATPAISQEMRELKMVTTWPKNFPGLGTGAQRVADRITAASGGRITVKLYAAGELVQVALLICITARNITGRANTKPSTFLLQCQWV